MFELEEVKRPAARIKVVGVGGAGGNAVNNMVASNIRAVEFIAVNTDEQDLLKSLALRKVQIGRNLTKGRGAGSKPEIGRQAALEDRDDIAGAIEGADMIFITAGMGGGTGTGASPVVAEIAKEMGILAVGVVTKPFFYEGGKRKRNAETGIEELRRFVDSFIVIPNDRISAVIEKGTFALDGFARANDVLRHAVQGISDIILVPGHINVDFADVKTVMECSGRAVMGTGTGSGEGRAREAARRAIFNPLLEDTTVEGAGGILINVTGGLDLTMDDLSEANTLVYEAAAGDAIIISGSVIDADLKDEVRVTVLATGFKKEEKAEAPSIDLPVRKWMAAPALKGSERVLAKSLEAGMDRLNIQALLKATEAIGRRREIVNQQ